MGGEAVMLQRRKKLLQQLDAMLDEAMAGTFDARSYDERLLSRIESKMARFLETSRLKQDQMAAERERVRSLIGDISHQTKTPLANILLYAQLLSEQELTGPQAKLAAQIGESAETLSFLIQSLVKVSRLESGVIKPEPKAADAHQLVEAAANQLAGIAAEKGISLVWSQDAAPVIALYDARWCAEALFNIIENAVKYTPAGGRITLSVTEYEMFARINIADTGRGIREEDLPQVFGRFWRAAESADSPGVGIGLYLAREIITACGGYIKVSSTPGQESVFSVFLSKV
jgi:signal transduction histidine kinase